MTTADHGSTTIAALEAAWLAIAERHPDVDTNVVFITGTGRTGRRGALKLGHVTTSPNWAQHRPATSRAKSDPATYREVFIAAETLARPAPKMLEVLIHEAAHTIADARGIKDVSRQNRYHNGRFRAIAEEMGLTWAHTEPARNSDGYPVLNEEGEPLLVEAKADTIIGYSDMTITAETEAAYRDEIRALDRGVSAQAHRAPAERTAPPRKRRTVCLVPTPGLATETVPDRSDAEDLLGYVLDDEEIQRLGYVVYNGLAERGLLVNHIAWVEEV